MAKRGRPQKKPGYDRDEELNALIATAAELFGEPYDDSVQKMHPASGMWHER